MAVPLPPAPSANPLPIGLSNNSVNPLPSTAPAPQGAPPAPAVNPAAEIARAQNVWANADSLAGTGKYVGQSAQQIRDSAHAYANSLRGPSDTAPANASQPVQPSLRNPVQEAATIKKLGISPQNPQQIAQMVQATYPPDVIAKDPELSAMVKAGVPQTNTGGLIAPQLPQGAGAAVYNPDQLKQQGYSDAQIQQLGASGTQANQMQAQLGATPKPTNSSLYVLEQALRAKSPIDDSQTDSLYQQAGIPTSGAGAYAALANNMQQHQAELSTKYKSYANMMQVAGTTMNDAYSNVLNGYKTSIDQYNHLQDQMFQTNQKMKDYENSLNLQTIAAKNQMALQTSAEKWEASHRSKQYVPADMNNGTPAGFFDPSSGSFQPTDTSGHITIPGYIDEPVPTAGSNMIGSVSGKYESNNNYGAVSSGVGDAGGVSYGAHQLSGGSITGFINNSGYANQFKGMKPGSQAFTQQWQQLAKSDPNFNNAQDQYIAQTHYQPLLNNLTKAGMGDVANRGQAVQEMIYSTGVQYGPSTDVITKALKGKDTSKMSDEQIISTVQNYKAETTGTYFKSSSTQVQDSVKNRSMNEMKDLLSLAEKVGGSGAFGATGDLLGGIAGAVKNFLGGGSQNQSQPQSNPQQPAQPAQSNGPADENGQPLNSIRQSIRSGTMDDSTLNRMRMQMTGLAKSGDPRGQQALDQFNQDLLYAKQNPPLSPETKIKYDQAYSAIQKNQNPDTAASQADLIESYKTLTGDSQSTKEIIDKYFAPNWLGSAYRSATGGQEILSPNAIKDLQTKATAAYAQATHQPQLANPQTNQFSVVAPDGNTYNFPDQKALDQFKSHLPS